MSETNDEGRVLRNCWTCGHKYEHGCAVMDEMTIHTTDEADDVYQWGEAFDWTADGLPDADADNCPGWTPKSDTNEDAEPTPKKRPRKSRPCQTEGCERIASGGAKHCRACRAEKPWRQELATLTRERDDIIDRLARAAKMDADAEHVIDMAEARVFAWDSTGEALQKATRERAAAEGAMHRLAGVEGLESKPDADGCEAIIRQELHERLALAERRQRERNSAMETVQDLTEKVGALTIERDEAANENCAWLALGSVTPSDWDGGADEWFRSFSLWVEGGARLEDWTDESGEGTVIGTVSSMARKRDAAVKELGDRVCLLTTERDEAVKALGVSRGVVRGQKERLRRVKVELDEAIEKSGARLIAINLWADRACNAERFAEKVWAELTLYVDRDLTNRRLLADQQRAFTKATGVATDVVVALNAERDDWKRIAEENADERRDARAEAGALRTRLHIMYAVAVLLGVAAVVGGVL